MQSPALSRWSAAGEFAEKAQKLPGVLEVAIVGSVAGNDPYQNDLDMAVIVRKLDEITTIAKHARQMSGHYRGWDIFLFDEGLKPLGRVCHCRECPGQSTDCLAPGCGQPPHPRVYPDFEYCERVFLKSPIDVLWTSFSTSRLLARRDELGITELRDHAALEDTDMECVICGKTFLFTGEEQKWYQKMGFSQPKRCQECRMGEL